MPFLDDVIFVGIFKQGIQVWIGEVHSQVERDLEEFK